MISADVKAIIKRTRKIRSGGYNYISYKFFKSLLKT